MSALRQQPETQDRRQGGAAAMDMQAYRIREWLQAEGSAQSLSPTMYPTTGTLRWGFVGACVLMEGVKMFTSAAASVSNTLVRAWPFRAKGTTHVDEAMLELITQEVFLPAAGHIQGLVELWWLHLGFVAGDAAQTYAATQSAADSQRRLQTWLALATPAWPARAMLLLAQAQFVALYTVGHMALPDVMRAISIYMEYGSSQACQALAKRIAQGDLQELGSAQVAPQICAMYGLEAGNLVEVLHVACEEAQQASATSLALLAAHGPMHQVRGAPSLKLPVKTLAVPGAPESAGQPDKQPSRGLGDLFMSVLSARPAGQQQQQPRNSVSLPPPSENEAPLIPSQTLALARASTVASSHASDVDDSAMNTNGSALNQNGRSKPPESKVPALSSIGRALSFKRSNGNGNGRSNGGSRAPSQPGSARSQRSQVQSDLLDSQNLAENTNLLGTNHSLREVGEIAENGDIPGGEAAHPGKPQAEPAAKAMAAMDKLWTSG